VRVKDYKILTSLDRSKDITPATPFLQDALQTFFEKTILFRRFLMKFL